MSLHLTDAARLLDAAYPNLTLHYADDRLYVMENGTLYHVRLNSDRDEDTGYAAMTLTYVSQHEAAIDSGRQQGDEGCTSPVELIVARMGATGSPDIVARGLLDAEAVAVDVRTLAMTSDMDGPLVRFLYFAYYDGCGCGVPSGERPGRLLDDWERLARDVGDAVHPSLGREPAQHSCGSNVDFNDLARLRERERPSRRRDRGRLRVASRRHHADGNDASECPGD